MAETKERTEKVVKAFKVVAWRDFTDYDCDRCPYENSEIFYENIYSTKVAAIRRAQKIFSRRNCRVYVYRLAIGEHGVSDEKRVYYKH